MFQIAFAIFQLDNEPARIPVPNDGWQAVGTDRLEGWCAFRQISLRDRIRGRQTGRPFGRTAHSWIRLSRQRFALFRHHWVHPAISIDCNL